MKKLIFTFEKSNILPVVKENKSVVCIWSSFSFFKSRASKTVEISELVEQ